jgi:hypothetical protein
MHVRYRFSVTGCLRLEYSFPIRTGLFTYIFETDENGVATYLNATAQVQDRSLWPRVIKDPQPGIKAHIQMSSPFFPMLQHDMRAVAGVLALYGVDDLTVDEAEEIWEPETHEEKDSLALYSMKRTTEATPPETWPRVSFDLVARALMTANRASDFEAALNFFRKGKFDVKSGHYIDAVLDFLFMLETTYANGKFKTAQVEAEYLASKELHDLIHKAVQERVLLENVLGHRRIEENFRRIYACKTSTEIIKYLVQLRGNLHHHTSRKSGIWHPADHVRFGADAYFLQQLCLDIAFAIASPTLFNEETVRDYQAQAHASASSGALKVHRK